MRPHPQVKPKFNLNFFVLRSSSLGTPASSLQRTFAAGPLSIDRTRALLSVHNVRVISLATYKPFPKRLLGEDSL